MAANSLPPEQFETQALTHARTAWVELHRRLISRNTLSESEVIAAVFLVYNASLSASDEQTQQIHRGRPRHLSLLLGLFSRILKENETPPRLLFELAPLLLHTMSYFTPKSQGLSLGYRLFKFWSILFGNNTIYQQSLHAFKFIGYEIKARDPDGEIPRDRWSSATGYAAVLVLTQLWRQLLSATLQIAKSERLPVRARDKVSVQVVNFVIRNRKDPLLAAGLKELDHQPWYPLIVFRI